MDGPGWSCVDEEVNGGVDTRPHCGQVTMLLASFWISTGEPQREQGHTLMATSRFQPIRSAVGKPHVEGTRRSVVLMP